MVVSAVWQTYYVMPNVSEGPSAPDSPPGGPGQPVAVVFYINNMTHPNVTNVWTNNTTVEWGTFLAGQCKSRNFTVQNNGLKNLNISILYSDLDVGWNYGYTKNNSLVLASSNLKGTLWLNCSYSASGINDFTSRVRVTE